MWHLCPLFKLAKAAPPGSRSSKLGVEFAAQRHPRAIPLFSGWSVSRLGRGPPPFSNAARLSPISDLRAAGRHRRALGLHNRTEVSWLGTPFLNRRNLSRKSCSVLGQRPSHLMLSGRNLAALRTGARRRRENGRLRCLFCRIERITRNKKYYSISLRGISDEYQQN